MQASHSCDICGISASDKKALELHFQGKKHMKRLEVLQRKKEAEESGIYVSGFPPRWSPQSLCQFFERFGAVEQFTHRGRYALVQFKDRVSAQRCLSTTLYLQGRPLLIKQRKQRPTNFKNDRKERKKKENDVETIDQHCVVSAVSEGSFNQQLSAFLDQIQLSDAEAYYHVCCELQMVFSAVYPRCKTYPFGSTVTGLAFQGSDLDVYMDLGLEKSPVTEDEVNFVFNTAKKLLYHNAELYTRVIPIPKAKTPIIKFVHKPTNISCDLNFKNALGIRNTRLIKFYLSLDHRLKPLLMIIKYWAKKNGLSGSGKISHYALVMLVLFYLQQLKKPVIPPVVQLQQSCPELIIEHWNSGFKEDASLYSSNDNEASIPELLRDFFKFCATFDYDLNVICPLVGKPIAKTLFRTPDKLPAEQNRYKQFLKTVQPANGLRIDCVMCIQDPFELKHNLTGGIGTNTLEIFKCYCQCAANLCSEALPNDDPKNSGFLKPLIGANMKPQLPPCGSNRCKIVINMGKCLPNPENDAGTETDALRSEWYNSVFEVLLEILHKVLKMQTDEVAEEGSNEVKKLGLERSNAAQKLKEESSNKVQKLEGQSDVGERSKRELETKVVLCVGHHSVWQKRKERTSKLIIPENLPTIEREQAISDMLIDGDQENKIESKFFCVFQPKQNPTCVNIQILNKMSRRDFQPLLGFLKKVLPMWIEQCLKERQNENLKHLKNIDNPDMQ